MSNLDPHNLDETQPYVAPDGNLDQPKKGWFGGCLVGCLIVGAISCVVCAGVGYYAYTQAPNLIFQTSRQVLTAVLEESGLPGEEQEAIMTQFDRVGDAYLAGDLPLQELGGMITDFAESPLMSMLLLYAVEATHLEESGLSEEEKTEARETFQRLFSGILNDQLEQAELEPLLRHVRQYPDATDPGQKQQVKKSFTDEEIREFIAEAKQLCDDKSLPLEETNVKISDKMREIIDKRLPTQ